MRPDNYNAASDHPIGATHPKYPDYYRATDAQMRQLHGEYITCVGCPMRADRKENPCDWSCGFGNTWVDAVTWIRIRLMENQEAI